MKITVVYGKPELIERRLDLLAIENDNLNVIAFEYKDKFGRKWKLEPVLSERILIPFIITPLPKE